jgi:hypothetical protein
MLPKYEKLDFNNVAQIGTAAIHMMIFMSFLLGVLWGAGVDNAKTSPVLDSVLIVFMITFVVYAAVIIKFKAVRKQRTEEVTVMMHEVKCLNEKEI